MLTLRCTARMHMRLCCAEAELLRALYLAVQHVEAQVIWKLTSADQALLQEARGSSLLLTPCSCVMPAQRSSMHMGVVREAVPEEALLCPLLPLVLKLALGCCRWAWGCLAMCTALTLFLNR